MSAARAIASRLLVVLAFGSLAATLLALLAGQWWAFELLSHFRLQYAAGQTLLLAAFALARRPAWSALLAVGIAVNALALAPYALPAAAPQEGVPLSLLVANVWGGNHDAAGLVATIERERPDLVLVIELTPELADGLERVHARYPYRSLAPESGYFGIGVYSRYPLAAHEHRMSGPNRAIDARIETEAGSLTLVGVHLLPPISGDYAARRDAELGELAAAVRRRDEPLLVCGDFNVSPYSPAYKRFVEAGGLVDGRRGRGLGFSWPAYLPVLAIPIDHCFTAGSVALANVSRLDGIGSDHYPQRFDFLLDPLQ